MTRSLTAKLTFYGNTFLLVKKTNREDMEISSVALSPIFVFIGGEAFVVAGIVTGFNSSFGIFFDVTGAIIFAAGIILAYLPIKKAADRQKKFKRHVISSEIENLLLHLSGLKLSLVSNERQIEKNDVLKDHYDSIISEIDRMEKKIALEVNQEKPNNIDS